MPSTTFLSEKLVDRLKYVKSSTIGTLHGILYDNSSLILGLSFEDNVKNNSDNSSEYQFGSSLLHYPTEVDYCGLVSFQSDLSTDNEQISRVLKAVEDISITDTPFVAIVNVSGAGPSDISWYCYRSKILERLEFKVLSEKEIKNQFITVRVCSKLLLTCENKHEYINEAMANLQRKISSADNLMFNFPEQNVFFNESFFDSNLSSNSTVADIISLQANEGSDTNSKKKGKSAESRNTGLLTAKMFLRSTKSDDDNDKHPSSPPIICQTKHESECLELWLDIDALSMVHTKKKLHHLSNILVDSVKRSLTLIEQALIRNSSSSPITYHYSLSQLSHFFTVVYPEKVLEDSLKSYRESIHSALGLPTNQPFFRRGNAHQFNKKEKSSSLLVNPHEGLGSSGVKQGEVAIVDGKYTYHHYMQDDINDNGWGCAYRSLQTIVSWFRLQGFTNHPIPTPEEIQKCLVNIGDKPPSFIGSRKWIGSTEISYCLETMLGVTSRIIAINSGEELSERGSELIYHFKTQGTPIMIGGGVLAHTIIGVHFNNKSGNIKLLIVDPHYVGSEDLKTIQEKGWVGWKPVSFWQKNTFYNLCLPLKPTCV